MVKILSDLNGIFSNRRPSNHSCEISHGPTESRHERVFFLELLRNNLHLVAIAQIMAKFLSGLSDHGWIIRSGSLVSYFQHLTPEYISLTLKAVGPVRNWHSQTIDINARGLQLNKPTVSYVLLPKIQTISGVLNRTFRRIFIFKAKHADYTEEEIVQVFLSFV